MSTDPMAALLACRAAWERSQPQLFLEVDALSEAGKDTPCPSPPGLTEGVPVCAHADTEVTVIGPPWYDGPPAQRHGPWRGNA